MALSTLHVTAAHLRLQLSLVTPSPPTHFHMTFLMGENYFSVKSKK